MRTLVAGTFDRLHIGHKALLDKAMEIAKNDILIIGLTSDRYAGLKKHPVRPYPEREGELVSYIFSKKGKENGIEFSITPIDSIACFPAYIDWDKLEVLVVSEETKRGGFEFCQIYRRKFKRNVKCVIVPVVKSRDGKRISTTRICNKEIELNGNICNDNDIIRDIMYGSYKGIFYGVEGSKSRKYHQPLLNWFLYIEQKKNMEK